jgi:hypothetical protein
LRGTGSITFRCTCCTRLSNLKVSKTFRGNISHHWVICWAIASGISIVKGANHLHSLHKFNHGVVNLLIGIDLRLRDLFGTTWERWIDLRPGLDLQ